MASLWDLCYPWVDGVRTELNSWTPACVCVCVCVCSLCCCVQLCNLMGCSPPGSSVHGISQARVVDWIVIYYSKGSSWPQDWTQESVSCTGKLILYHCASRVQELLAVLWEAAQHIQVGLGLATPFPGTAESHRVRHNWSNLAAAAATPESSPSSTLSELTQRDSRATT